MGRPFLSAFIPRIDLRSFCGQMIATKHRTQKTNLI
jgi:hypothetical protein